MRQRRTTVPPTRATSRSSPSGRSELIARENEKQSAKRRTALDNRFHRTALQFTGADRDAMKQGSRSTVKQRLASGATASWTKPPDGGALRVMHVRGTVARW
jgi:hypothetical protein